MHKKLANQNYITIDTNNHIHLTDKGIEIAKNIYDRHRTLTSLLIKLGVDEKTEEKDVCKLEHNMSETTFEVFKKNK